MDTTRKTITLSKQQDAWIKARIESGDYTNDSEYIRDLIRRDQEQSARFMALKLAVQDGLASGESERTVRDIWDEAEERARKPRG
jgi:antitoxin ParD1/3/4